jgi:hypothetical protein
LLRRGTVFVVASAQIEVFRARKLERFVGNPQGNKYSYN